MVKTKQNIIFALFVAFALIFAAGCSDGSDEDWEAASGADTEQASSEQGESGGSEQSGNTDNGQGSGGEQGSAGEQGGSTGGEQGESSGSGQSGDTDNGQGSGGEQGSAGEQGGNIGGEQGGSTGGEQGESSGSGQGESSGGEAQLAEITEDNVTELLQKIGEVAANDTAKSSCYWDFANGALESDVDEGFIFTVPLNNSTSNKKPMRKNTLSNLKEKGIVSIDFLTVDLSNAEWKDKPESPSDTRGTIIADIELADAAKSSYTIPENLKSVTIVLETDNWTYN